LLWDSEEVEEAMAMSHGMARGDEANSTPRNGRRRPSGPRPELGATTGATPALPRLIDIETVADLLDVNVRHVRRLVTERRIPFLKWGRLLRFDAEEIAAWLEEARVPSQPSAVGARATSTAGSRSVRRGRAMTGISSRR
jgi:excisionase family DNA binding protein